MELGEILTATFSGLLVLVTGFLAWATVALAKANRRMVNLQDTFQRFEMSQRNPEVLGRRAELLRFPSSPAFVVELGLMNPGALPIELEQAIVNLQGLDVRTHDYTRMREEFKLIKPNSAKKTTITVNTTKAQDKHFWPQQGSITLVYVSGLGTKHWHQDYEVHPRDANTAFLIPCVREEPA